LDSESIAGVAASQFFIDGLPDAEVEVVASSLRARLYPAAASSEFLSSPVRLLLRNRGSEEAEGESSALPTVTFTLQNNVLQDYETFDPQLFVNTTCEIGVITQFNHSCPGGPAEDLTVLHNCTGSVSTVTTKCPVVRRKPICRTLGDSVVNCTTVSFNATSIVCQCVASPGSRGLTEWEEIGMSVVVVSTVVVDDFVTTMETAKDFSSVEVEGQQKTLLVPLLFGGMWGIGLLGIVFCSVRQQSVPKVVTSSRADLEAKKKTAMQSPSPQAVRSYLTAYIDEVFPV
jgi:hypothetical protein